MRCARFGLLHSVLVSALVACAQPADTFSPPSDECNASQTVCEKVVVTPPFRPDLPEVSPGEPQEFEGLRFQARITSENTALGDEPMSLGVLVTIENPTSEVMTLDTSGCRLKLLAYDQPESASGARAAQATFEQPCNFSGSPTLEPGGTARLEVYENDYYTSVALPDGRYYFDLQLTLSGQTLTLPAGSADVRFFVPNLSYRAATEVAGVGDAAQLRAAVTVENRNDETVFLTYGACALNVQLYRTADRSGKPVYDPLAQPDVGCPAYLAHSEIEAGGALLADEFEVSAPLSEIEAAVAEPGYYYVQLSLELDWRTTVMDVGVLYVAP